MNETGEGVCEGWREKEEKGERGEEEKTVKKREVGR